MPILRYIHTQEPSLRPVTVGQIATATGLDPNLVVPEVERLIDSGLLPGPLKRLASGGDVRPWHLLNARLTGDGARALNVWPQADDILRALTVLAESETDPEKKTRFQRLLAAVKEVGLPVVTEVLAKVVEQQTGLR